MKQMTAWGQCGGVVLERTNMGSKQREEEEMRKKTG